MKIAVVVVAHRRPAAASEQTLLCVHPVPHVFQCDPGRAPLALSGSSLERNRGRTADEGLESGRRAPSERRRASGTGPPPVAGASGRGTDPEGRCRGRVGLLAAGCRHAGHRADARSLGLEAFSSQELPRWHA